VSSPGATIFRGHFNIKLARRILLAVTRLVAKDGAQRGQQIEIGAELYVGREGQQLVVDDLEVSRRHAVLRSSSQGVTVEDLGSRNGTFVNGERIDRVTLLAAGDVVKFGTTSFAFDSVNTGAFELPAVVAAGARGRGVPASRMLWPEILTYVAVIGTATALVLYFALR
jgi:pSer/pThr/pTyr-binding forkhead associated (FHA) protein